MDASAFEQGVRRCIPSEFVMIAGSEDAEEAEEIYNAARKFDLPYVKGKEGGLCTSIFLNVLYQNIPRVVVGPNKAPSSEPLTCHQLLKSMYATSKAKGYTPVPQMTASRPLEAQRPFYIVPPGATGRRRALIIGINYTGQQGQIRAPQNDAHNVQQLLIRKCGFDPQEILMLVDDGEQMSPTKQNIQAGLQQMVAYSRPGDVLVVSFSGHGGRVADKDGDEEDGYDSSLMPVDFASAGQIVDDDLLKYFIKAIPAGVHTTMLVDACHCGSVGDLPYTLGADKATYRMEKGFNMETYQEAMAKDKAAYEAEQERKRAKEERRKEREAIRQRRAEQEALEKANATSAATVGAPGATTRVNQTPITIHANNPEELQALASKFGASMQFSPDQVAAMARQGGGTISTGPMMMTPEQAAVFQAKHNNGAAGGPIVMVGKPVPVNAGGYPRSSSRTKTAPLEPVRKVVGGSKPAVSSFKTVPLAPGISISTKTVSSAKKPVYAAKPSSGVGARKVVGGSKPAVSSFKTVPLAPGTVVSTKKVSSTKQPVSAAKPSSRVAALRGKFGG
uniref:Peptidase C14 caspase domain-containing protein n=1 Tax=Amphora coffeiformis TaxID=265554 RepID=A0A7S3KWD1_9STRA|eukprot:scaffold6750_cov160-Amphora_coffeaeformis.AAC.15